MNAQKSSAPKTATAIENVSEVEQMNVVIVGHVDHGKSTLVGRLLADTKSLPDGKLDAVKANCARNSKPFEYAFLLDALKDEQSQGITIDTARCFFKSSKRDYIIIDAPGHIEFLKNMVTGAARAEAAMLVIDAHEGIQENSKRHGYMMSFLGIKNVTVCVNKMDLVDYDQKVFEQICSDFTAFLAEINITPHHFIPISAREGDCITKASKNMSWYKGATILEAFDGFEKAAPLVDQPFRMPLQDVYKFTNFGDDRRIFAGRVESGKIQVGDDVIFMPSRKTSKVKSIEIFNVDPLPEYGYVGQSLGVSLETQIYVKPGEVMCKASEKISHVTNRFKANVFWMAKQPLIQGKNYKLKIVTQQVPVVLVKINSVLDASELSSISKSNQINRHDVAECVFETLKPIAFDEIHTLSATGRFVIVNDYEISGGGIMLAPVFEDDTTLNQYVRERNFSWERSHINSEKRSQKYDHKPALIVIAGQQDKGKLQIAKELEEQLFNNGCNTYFLGIPNDLVAGSTSSNDKVLRKYDQIRQLGEMAHIMTDAGLLMITRISNVDDHEIKMIESLTRPNNVIVVQVGEDEISSSLVDLHLPDQCEPKQAVKDILTVIKAKIIPDPEFMI